MPFTVTMPKLSPTMDEGIIAKWHIKEGDFVDVGDILLEVSTDKATVEHAAIDSGYLRKIIIPDGQSAQVNQPIALFTETKDEKIEEADLLPAKPSQAESKAASAKAAEDQSQARDTVRPSEASSVKQTAQAQAGAEPKLSQPVHDGRKSEDQETGRILASPLARKLAKERGLDLSSVQGTGPSGRIMSRDLEKAQPAAGFTFNSRLAPQQEPGSFIEEPLSPMRKVIAQRLLEAKTTIPHFYVQQSIEVANLVDLREQLSRLELKISINDCVVKACALALRKHPTINSGFNAANNTIMRFQTIDISVAVSVSGGLITPIIRHADFKNLGEISSEVRALAKRAKEGKLNPQEYQGGSFTVSNLGMYGVTNFQAIINPPQAAILAVSGIQNVPIVKNGTVVPGKIMNVTLSADHRVIDGVAAAEFLKTLQTYLENPAALLL